MHTFNRLLFLTAAAAILAVVVDVNNRQEKKRKIENPFKEVKNLDEAMAEAQFEMSAPEIIDDYSQKNIEVINDEMIQIHYENSLKESLTIRKARGNDDISGDYNEYSIVKTINIYDTDYTLKGNAGKIHVITWVKDNFTFAVQSNEGFKTDIVVKMIKEIA